MKNPDGINEVSGVRRFALRLLALWLWSWNRTLRFEISPEDLAQLADTPAPVAYVVWHNRLFLTAEIFRRFCARRKIHVLVSASRDGAWLAAFFRLVGLEPVRGSSSRLGREAGRVLIEVMRRGHDIGITPDGPRGPLYSVEPGALTVARRNHAPLILIGVEFTRAWRLRSWDRFYLPWPFSRVRLRCSRLPASKTDGSKTTPEELRSELLVLNPDRPETPSS